MPALRRVPLDRVSRLSSPVMKRLFHTSVGPLEVEVDGVHGVVSAYRFGEDGRVVAETGDEWENADLADLLTSEVGVPVEEAREIAAHVVAAWVEAGGAPPPEPSGKVGLVIALTVVASVVASAAVGAWTIVRALLRL